MRGQRSPRLLFLHRAASRSRWSTLMSAQCNRFWSGHIFRAIRARKSLAHYVKIIPHDLPVRTRIDLFYWLWFAKRTRDCCFGSSCIYPAASLSAKTQAWDADRVEVCIPSKCHSSLHTRPAQVLLAGLNSVTQCLSCHAGKEPARREPEQEYIRGRQRRFLLHLWEVSTWLPAAIPWGLKGHA